MLFKTIALVLALLTCGSDSRAAADTWRLAGTFNGWNTGDDAWRLEPATDGLGGWALTRPMQAGLHRFKFVRNGDWSRGHLGAASSGGLEEPGADIELAVRAPATYCIRLFPEQRTWSVSLANVDEPVMLVARYGTPVAGQPFRVDASESLLDPQRAAAIVEASGEDWSITPVSTESLEAMIVVRRPGAHTIPLQVRYGSDTLSHALEVDVQAPITLRYREHGEGPAHEVAMESFDDGLALAVVRFDKATMIDELQVVGEQTLLNLRQARVSPGEYAVMVRDGEVVTHRDPQSPMCLLPGNWHRFEYMPEITPLSVHVAGDFNGWAGPGQEGAIRLSPRVDGVYAAVVNLPDGAHRYKFVLDGERWIVDPVAERTSTDTDGNLNSIAVAGPTPADFDAARRNHINESAVRHNPDLARDFLPIEADLGLVEISVSTLPGDVASAMLHIDAADPQTGLVMLKVPMTRRADESGFDRFTARVAIGRGKAEYGFVLTDGQARLDTARFRAEIIPSPDLPAWAMGAVWYQIFPERFRNGNPDNDPHGPGIFQMPWMANWYETQPGEEAQWRPRAGLSPTAPLPERQGGEIFNWIYDRRYGGDLQGVVEKLDELKELGVTAIYFNPVFEAESMHKYDASDYRHIDDNFGTPAGQPVPAKWQADPTETLDPATWKWTAADRYFLDVLLPACRDRGLRVVIDGVFNHTGRDFWAFQHVLEHGAASPYAEWYFVEFAEDGAVDSWQAWDGPSGWLPKFRQMPNGDLTPGIKQHLMDITSRWMDPDGDGDPSDGIDGWRLDVPLDVGLPFWRDWHAHVKSINPEAIVIAEIWDDAANWLRGEYFDTQMHYPFAKPVVDWLGVQPGMPASELSRRLAAAFNEAPQTCLIHQNLFGSHDTDRFVSQLHNPGRGYDQGNRIQDNGPNYNDTRPSARTYELALLGVAIQATYLGSPMMYYGDEYGMWGADDPTDRKPLPWPDLGRPENADDRPSPRFREDVASWLRLRQDERLGPILRYGTVRHLDSGEADVFAFERELNGQRAVVVVNRGDRSFGASRLLPPGRRDTRVGAREARCWYVAD